MPAQKGMKLTHLHTWYKSGSLTESHYTINSFGIAGDSPSPSGIPPHLKLKTHTCIHSQHDCHSICKQMGHLVEPAKSRSRIFLWMDWEKHFVTLSRISKGSWMPVIGSAAKARSRGNCVLIVSPPEVFNPIAQTFGKLTWKLLGIQFQCQKQQLLCQEVRSSGQGNQWLLPGMANSSAICIPSFSHNMHHLTDNQLKFWLHPTGLNFPGFHTSWRCLWPLHQHYKAPRIYYHKNLCSIRSQRLWSWQPDYWEVTLKINEHNPLPTN